jgi:PcfJ-like protein
VLGLSLRIITPMPSTVTHASPRVDAPRATHRPSMAATLERQLARFSKPQNQRVRTLAARHPRLADLALSFPALLFALAAPRRGFHPEPVIERVIAGARLAELSQLAGVPTWMRKLHPEAFDRPLPARLPNGDLFRRQIANHLPRHRRTAAKWLQAVTDAADWGTEPLAVWVARELVRNHGKPRAVYLGGLRIVALWAWFCTQPTTLAHTYTAKSWHPSMTFKTALSLANEWRENLDLYLNLGPTPIDDLWLTPGTVDGLVFVPLRSVQDIIDEATAMKNCLRGYGDCLAHKRCRLWSVRKDDVRIATLEISGASGDPMPTISQMQGPSNNDVALEIWWAARRWLHDHDLPQIKSPRLAWGQAPLDPTAWAALWKPYWLAKRRFPNWLPRAPSRSMLNSI